MERRRSARQSSKGYHHSTVTSTADAEAAAAEAAAVRERNATADAAWLAVEAMHAADAAAQADPQAESHAKRAIRAEYLAKKRAEQAQRIQQLGPVSLTGPQLAKLPSPERLNAAAALSTLRSPEKANSKDELSFEGLPPLDFDLENSPIEGSVDPDTPSPMQQGEQSATSTGFCIDMHVEFT